MMCGGGLARAGSEAGGSVPAEVVSDGAELSEPSAISCGPRLKSLSHSVPNRPAIKPASTPSRIIPSSKCSPPCTSSANRPTAPTEIISSRLSRARRIGTGATKEAAPKTSVTFATFEPMTLPMPRSLSPLAAAMPETAISGALVPKPTITAADDYGRDGGSARRCCQRLPRICRRHKPVSPSRRR